MDDLKEKICEVLFKRSEYTRISEINGLHQLHEREFDNVAEEILGLIEDGKGKLTKKQASILSFLKKMNRKNGTLPNYREVQEEFGYKSCNSVTQHLQSLEKKGYLKKVYWGYELVESA